MSKPIRNRWATNSEEMIADMLEDLRLENARLQMELEDASRNAEELRQVRAENAALRSLLREAITDHVSPYDLPESEDYIARVKTALGETG